MARITETTRADAPRESQQLWDEQIKLHGRMTNMKKTLARSPHALRALMEWYPLRDCVAAFLGERLTTLFAHAVSAETDCLICTTFFRRLLTEAGENPDALHLDDWEHAVVNFARQLAHQPNRVADQVYEPLAKRLDARQIVELTVFGGMMLATNVFNNALQVNLDDYLEPYRGFIVPKKEQP